MGDPITAALAGGSSLFQFSETRRAGAQQKYEYKMQAKQEDLMAKQREADRKYRLAEALGSQQASAGARGLMAFEGSPLSILQEDIRLEEQATERDVYQTELSKAILRSKGKAAKRQADIQAFTGLFKDIKSMGGVGGAGQKGKQKGSVGGMFGGSFGSMKGTRFEGSTAPKGNLGGYYGVSTGQAKGFSSKNFSIGKK